MRMNRILTAIAISMLLLVLPAAASDYTLGTFGNANGDDTINRQDVTYIELVIPGTENSSSRSGGTNEGGFRCSALSMCVVCFELRA